MTADPADRRRAWLARGLGGLAGAALGLVANYLPYRLVTEAGGSYPVEPTTLVVVALGIFGGVELSDRLGRRAAPVLAAALGVLLAVAIVLAAR